MSRIHSRICAIVAATILVAAAFAIDVATPPAGEDFSNPAWVEVYNGPASNVQFSLPRAPWKGYGLVVINGWKIKVTQAPAREPKPALPDSKWEGGQIFLLGVMVLPGFGVAFVSFLRFAKGEMKTLLNFLAKKIYQITPF